MKVFYFAMTIRLRRAASIMQEVYKHTGEQQCQEQLCRYNRAEQFCIKKLKRHYRN